MTAFLIHNMAPIMFAALVLLAMTGIVIYFSIASIMLHGTLL